MYLCLYSNCIKKIISLKPSKLELSESLEQLRWLENGYTVKLNTTKFDSFSIDTKEDLIFAEEFINKNNLK